MLGLLFCAAAEPAGRAEAASAGVVDEYLDRAAERLTPQARDVLLRIRQTPRRLLALRAYLRAVNNLAERWSWSDAQVEAFMRSEEYSSLAAEIERVRETFEQRNPGYTLYANTQVRTVNMQLQRWNENAGVARAGLHLHRAARAELLTGDYPAVPSDAALARFIQFLIAWRPPAAPPLAAPGLSLHGQSRAIDFQIVRAGRIIAGADIASVRSIWEKQGWARRLRDAVGSA
ncbi:MAG TPA: hypothetical protein VHK24_04900, partial [Steroidobacter sp.]|nr:hypothetical protein [Steroidobacter sp.]